MSILELDVVMSSWNTAFKRQFKRWSVNNAENKRRQLSIEKSVAKSEHEHEHGHEHGQGHEHEHGHGHGH